jgi:hypothetical protein
MGVETRLPGPFRRYVVREDAGVSGRLAFARP